MPPSMTRVRRAIPRRSVLSVAFGSRLAGRRIVALAVLGFALACGITAYARIIAAGGGNHQTADWLISYAGEFVRRGLFGEVLLAVTPPGPATLWVLFALQVAMYVPVVGFVVWFLARTQWSWSAIALACSPAGLAFIGWDAAGGFRKEVLGFCALAFLATARLATRTWLRRAALALSLVAWTVGLLSWEAIVFMAPAVLFLLWAGRPMPQTLPLTGVYGAIGLAALAASVTFSGSGESAARACHAIVTHGLDEKLCSGSIAWVGADLQLTLDLVKWGLNVNVGHLLMLPLAALPIVFTGWFRRYWPWALAMVVGVAPLFVLGLDWGRWIHIMFMQIALCMMVAAADLIESPQWTGVAALLYVTLWGLPHATPSGDVGSPNWPFTGLIATLITALQEAMFAWKR